MKNLKWWVKRFFWFISFSDKKTCLTSKSPIKFTLVMPSVAVWLSGGPCWLQHLFWPWTALASAWACALPRLGVFFFFFVLQLKKIQPTFLLGPLPSPLKKVGGGDVFWRFSFFRAKKRAPGQPSPTKKTRGKQTSLLSIFPGFWWDFFRLRCSVNRWENPGLTRCMVHALGPLGLGGQFAHTMLGPQQWAHAVLYC